MTRDTAERARELLTEIAEARGPFKMDNHEFANSAIENCQQNARDLLALLPQIQSEARERLAAWMIEHSFSTGHGDTFEDLLKELDWQVKELRGECTCVRA